MHGHLNAKEVNYSVRVMRSLRRQLSQAVPGDTSCLCNKTAVSSDLHEYIFILFVTVIGRDSVVGHIGWSVSCTTCSRTLQYAYTARIFPKMNTDQVIKLLFLFKSLIKSY